MKLFRQIYFTFSLTHILKKYQCHHLRNKRNYAVYRTGTGKIEGTIKDRPAVLSLLHLNFTLHLD